MTDRKPLTDEELRRYSLLAARMNGCTCVPEITLRRNGGIAMADVAHDPDCKHKAMRAGEVATA